MYIGFLGYKLRVQGSLLSTTPTEGLIHNSPGPHMYISLYSRSYLNPTVMNPIHELDLGFPFLASETRSPLISR